MIPFERVERAFTTLISGRSFMAQQQRWLEYVREYLIANLTSQSGDFDALPIFARDGNRARANREFDGKFVELLQLINEAVAA